MCSLESEPWRANFTGPKCRCGVPTAGTPAERMIEMQHRADKQRADKIAFDIALAEERERRINELFKKYRG